MPEAIVVHDRHGNAEIHMPKLHKQPYGSRFIAASYKCTTKFLSKILITCLNTIMTHYRQYCNGIYARTGVNCFWVIENSQQVLGTLSRINYFSLAKHNDSYDFSTLYTSIPHDSQTAIKDSLTHRPSSQGWASSVRFYVVLLCAYPCLLLCKIVCPWGTSGVFLSFFLG